MQTSCLVPGSSSHASPTLQRPQAPAGWGQSGLHQGNAFSKPESFCDAYERPHKTRLLNVSEHSQPQALRVGTAFRGPRVRPHILKMRKLRPEEGCGLLFAVLTPTTPSAPRTALHHACPSLSPHWELWPRETRKSVTFPSGSGSGSRCWGCILVHTSPCPHSPEMVCLSVCLLVFIWNPLALDTMENSESSSESHSKLASLVELGNISDRDSRFPFRRTNISGNSSL